MSNRRLKSQIEWLEKRDSCGNTQCIKDMYSKRIDYLWNECFDYVRGKMEYVKYTEAMDVINKEENAKTINLQKILLRSFLLSIAVRSMI